MLIRQMEIKQDQIGGVRLRERQTVAAIRGGEKSNGRAIRQNSLEKERVRAVVFDVEDCPWIVDH